MNHDELKELYLKRKELLWNRVGIHDNSYLKMAETREEQEFYQTVNDFFLQQTQKELLKIK